MWWPTRKRRQQIQTCSHWPRWPTASPSIVGDIRDAEHLRRVVAKSKPEIVFHLAAQPLVRESYKDPITTYATNVMGTVHLLECVRQVGSVRAVVCVTSDKCYENREWIWGYRENEAMGGYDPYSSSKGCAEIVAAAYRNSFFNPNRFPEHGTCDCNGSGGKCCRWGRLGKRPIGSGYSAVTGEWRTRHSTKSTGNSSVATRFGAAQRLPDAG